jgi:MoaA/NifB/PqqE/SkfB family radical SAM enzyme
MQKQSMKPLPFRRYLSVLGRLTENMLKGEAINPFYASYKVTNRCEYRCRFCNVWYEKTPILDTVDSIRVLDNLERAGIFLLSFEGGEPLLREDIHELLQHVGRKQYFLLFTTCDKRLPNLPMQEYCKYIDFLHISIDEGHDNLHMFDLLPEAVTWGSIVCVQVVVTRDDLPALEDKVARCHEHGAKCVIMPAVQLNHTRDFFPDVEVFESETLRLKKLYPLTIISPDTYFQSLRQPHGCSTGSIIVDTDGGLFYPCRTLEKKPVNLVETDLFDWLRSDEAGALRDEMAACDRNCGWYQYYAINAFTSPVHVFNAVAPYARAFFSRHRKTLTPAERVEIVREVDNNQSS